MLWTFSGEKNALFFSKNRRIWSLGNSPAPGEYERLHPYLWWQPLKMVAELAHGDVAELKQPL
jgi:hypothetical protein